MGLTNTDKQTYINVTNEEDEYYPDPEYSFGTFAQISETIDVCIAGNESPAIAVSTIYNDFINTGWLNTNGGNYWSLSDAVTAIESNHIGEVGFDFSKNTSYGQIIVAFDPDGTFTDGPPDCSLGSYAHAFAISMSYSPNFNVE